MVQFSALAGDRVQWRGKPTVCDMRCTFLSPERGTTAMSLFPDAYEGVYNSRRSTCGWQLYDAVGAQKGDRAASEQQMIENFRLFGAPNFLLITTPKTLGPYGISCGILGVHARLVFNSRRPGCLTWKRMWRCSSRPPCKWVSHNPRPFGRGSYLALRDRPCHMRNHSK
jgi:hypothetical protein